MVSFFLCSFVYLNLFLFISSFPPSYLDLRFSFCLYFNLSYFCFFYTDYFLFNHYRIYFVFLYFTHLSLLKITSFHFFLPFSLANRCTFLRKMWGGGEIAGGEQRWHGVEPGVLRKQDVCQYRHTVAPEPVELKLFCGTGAGTGAIISYFNSGSTAPELKLSFYKYFTIMSSVWKRRG